MENKEELFAIVRKLRIDCAVRQKKGLHFIVASVIVWLGIIAIHASSLQMESKNMYTFICSAPLMGLAMLLAKPLRIDFQCKDNPLTNLGIFFSMNQVLYLIIAMWIYAAMPEKMLMVYTMIFGAHLLPYGWLYGSRSYLILSVLIPIVSLLIGLFFEPVVLAVFMLITEIGFCISLMIENKKLLEKIKAEAAR
jgi:hypothetical protein